MNTNTTDLNHEQIFLLALKELLPSFSRYTDKQIISKVGKELFEDGLNQTVDFIYRSCGTALTKNEEFGMYVQVLKCLGSYITNKMKLAVTPFTVMSNAGMIPYAVSQAFPFYAEAGLLKSIIAPRSIIVIAQEAEEEKKAS